MLHFCQQQNRHPIPNPASLKQTPLWKDFVGPRRQIPLLSHQASLRPGANCLAACSDRPGRWIWYGLQNPTELLGRNLVRLVGTQSDEKSRDPFVAQAGVANDKQSDLCERSAQIAVLAELDFNPN